MAERKENERVQGRDKLTLRMGETLNKKTKDKADYLGVSQNAFLLVLIELGLRCYEINPHLLEEK